jgi:phenylacetate-CoA ligase
MRKEDGAMSGGDAAFWDEAAETMSRDALHDLQCARLRRQVARCHAASELYRARFRQVGAEPGDIKDAQDLARLPVVTKEELRADQAAHPPFGTFVVCDAATWRELHPSTGTTGVPVSTIWSAEDVATITDFTARTMWSFGVRPTDIVQNGLSYGLWVAGMSVHYATARLGCLMIATGTGVTTDRQIDYFLQARPTVFLATPSYALHIAERLRERGIEPDSLALRLGAFGGEPGAETPATRAKIESGLGIDAFDYYGLAEVGPTFANECWAKTGIHFAEDHVLVECVDPDTKEAVPEGELGVLVFTHLTREATPMLRYWSNDYARLTTGRCPCGRTHARAVGGILGRHDDLLVFKGAKFYPIQVEKVVRALTPLADEFRIEVRREPGGRMVATCTVVAECLAEPPAGLDARLQQALRAELGVTPGIRLEPYGTLERTTFKAKRIVEL